MDVCVAVLLTIIMIVTLYPLIYVISCSISSPAAVLRGEVVLLPVRPTLMSYEKVFQEGTLNRGIWNSVVYTAVGTIINLILTTTGAYALSEKNLFGRSFLSKMIMFTMMFSGGLIPTYMVVKDLGLLNTMWSLVLPNAIGVTNFMIMRNTFENSIPLELKEAAYVEGASQTRIFLVMADGKIYAFPHLKLGDNMLTNKIFVNPDWLEAVGLEMPTNFAEFEAMLYAFRDNDCNGNGDATDEIPYIIRYNDYHFLPSLYTFFGLGNRGTAHRYVDWDEEKNALRFIPTSEQFKDLLTVAQKWYADGLIDPETFQNTSSKQIVAKAGAGLVGVHSDFVTNTGSVYQDIFRCIPVMENYYGEKLYTRRSQTIASLGAFVVSAECPYVDELVKWADYFYGEEGMLMYNMGVEGVTFEFDENGKPQWKDEMIHDPNGLTLTQKRVQYMGFQSGCGAWTDDTYQGAETYWTSTELMDDYRKYLPTEIWEAFSPTPEEAEEIDYLWTDIQSYLNESIAGFITGSISLDTWDQYVATIEGMGLARYMEIYDAMYQRYVAN